MTDPEGTAEQPETQGDAENGQYELLTIEDRANLNKLAIFANRNMVSVTGAIDQWKVADEIEPTILQAIVTAEKERSRKGVPPTRLMEIHFPEVPKRSEVQSDDEDVLAEADATYGKVKDEVFRVLNVMPNGPIQSRLAENGDGLVLCRMKGVRGAEEVAYVTRNKKCIDLDNNQPAYKAAQRAQAKADKLTGMSMERVPEAAKFFRSKHNTSLKQINGASTDVIQAALEAATEESPEAAAAVGSDE